MATNQDVYVKIIAQDGASETFRKIGTTAQMTGNQVGQAAQKASRDWTDASRKIGAAIGATTALAIRANNASEQSQARLKSSIEATGKSYDQYADAINRATKKATQLAFDDEDAADAIATLTQATGDAEKAIKDLSLAEDVARARKIDLAAATNIVVAAEEGRYGALARMGIQIDANASREEALAAIQQKVSGQSQAYAETSAATWDRYRIDAENALESVGAKLADHQAEILAASSAWTAFGGAITSAVKVLGASGVAQLLSIGGLAAVGAVGYSAAGSWNQPGSNWATNLVGQTFATGQGLLNSILPGSPFHSEQWNNALNANKIEDVFKGMFFGIDGSSATQILAVLQRIGAIPEGVKVSKLDQAQQDYYLNNVRANASGAGLTTGQYISTLASRPESRYVLDPVSGQYIDAGLYPSIQRQRENLAAGTGDVAPTGPNPKPGFFKSNRPTSGAYGAMADDTQSHPEKNTYGAANYEQVTAALKEQYGAYYTLADGVITASDAIGAFKTAQDGIIASEGKYSGQLSEYSTQLNNLDAAYQVLQERQAAGQELTKSDQEFLDGYTAAHERLAGGVDDATVALGKQAEAYANNMSAADEFKSATGDMTTAVYDLINALAGIPGYVQTAVNVDVNDGGAYNLGAYLTWLNGQEFRTRWVNETVNITTGQVAGPIADMGGMHGLSMYAHGGFSSGNYALVGERGPEVVWLPRGAQVTNTEATQNRMRRSSGSGGDTHYHIHGGIHVSANTPDEFATALGHVRR